MTAAPAIDVAVIAISAQLGGTERVLLDLAHHASDERIRLSVLLPLDGPLRAALEATGADVYVVPPPAGTLQGSQRGWRLLTSGAGTLRRLRHWGDALANHPAMRAADLVCSIGFKPHLAAARCPPPRVWHVHEYPPRLTGWLWRRLGRREPDGVAFNSAAVSRAWFRPATPNNPSGHSRIAVAVNGVDLELFRPRAPTGWIHDALGIPTHHRLLGMPAVLARWKGQLAVREAFRMVQQDLGTVHLVFVGSGIYDTASETRHGRRLEAALQTASGDRVHLLPFQADIERVYPEFTATLHYSLRPEPFGRVVVESMACGVPVIAADEGGPRDILGTDPAAGWLVPPRSPRALARALYQALSQSPETLAAAGEAARRVAEDGFSAARFARDLGGFFHEVVAANPR